MLYKLQVPCGKTAGLQAQASCCRSTLDGVGQVLSSPVWRKDGARSVFLAVPLVRTHSRALQAEMQIGCLGEATIRMTPIA